MCNLRRHCRDRVVGNRSVHLGRHVPATFYVLLIRGVVTDPIASARTVARAMVGAAYPKKRQDLPQCRTPIAVPFAHGEQVLLLVQRLFAQRTWRRTLCLSSLGPTLTPAVGNEPLREAIAAKNVGALRQVWVATDDVRLADLAYEFLDFDVRLLQQLFGQDFHLARNAGGGVAELVGTPARHMRRLRFEVPLKSLTRLQLLPDALNSNRQLVRQDVMGLPTTRELPELHSPLLQRTHGSPQLRLAIRGLRWPHRLRPCHASLQVADLGV
mmetsp:Transcript_81399/g.226720  ORF Transcript_81399/g.226720 Transcript_81399/m.226720 type:complete len:270 (+) Transcript_81399:462-1271(+)